MTARAHFSPESVARPVAPRIGLFGGTFNPIHVGHLRAAEEVAEALDLERVIFIPAAQPPHKASRGSDVVAPPAERLAWVRLAVANNPRFAVDPLEIERSGPSYSVDTLQIYATRLSPQRPVFILGRDACTEIGTWREPHVLFALAHILVMTRPPHPVLPLAELLPGEIAAQLDLAPDGFSAQHRSAGTWTRLLEITALDVSASDIRARLRTGRSVRYLFPDAVCEAVLRSEVYAGQRVAL